MPISISASVLCLPFAAADDASGAEAPSALRLFAVWQAEAGIRPVILSEQGLRQLRQGGLPAALEAVFACEDDALVEPYIRGREIQVGLLGDKALPPIEIVCEHTFFDYVMKYQAGACREICPAPIDDETTARLQEAALTAFHALGLEVYSRADFILR